MVAADEEKDEEAEGDAEEEEEGHAEEEKEGDAEEEEEGDAEVEEEGDAEKEEGDLEEGSGDDSEEEVYIGDGEEAEDDNAEDYDNLEEEGMEDTGGDGGERAKKRRRDGNGKGKKAAGGRGGGGERGRPGERGWARESEGGWTHMQGQHLNHWIIWLRKFHGGEVGQNDHFPEGGYGIDDEVLDGGVKWVGPDTWSAPPTEGVPARKGQQLITQTYPKCFDKDHLQQAICECVVATDQAFTVVEHPTCAVEKVIPSRSTLARQIIRLAGLARIKLMEMLAADGVGAVALMHYIWTGENHRSYISVTSHCVNEKFELMQITLDFCAMPGKHISARIIEVLLDVVKEWNLEKQCIAVTSNNASANIAAMEFLCRGGPTDCQPPLFFSGMHVRCMGHICDLAIQLGLKKVLDIKKPLGIVRDLASFIGLSPNYPVREDPEAC
ncbi:unnamed protein product [Closterium sp. NIES-65]|nr:unnamed protein product [Closterium sp. NIES-65]